MAIKPIIDIEINDERFKRFIELFNEYKAGLGDMPDAWAQINGAMDGAGKSLESGAISAKDALAIAAAQAGVIAEELNHATHAQHEFHRATGSSERAMKGLSDRAKGLSQTIFGIGKWVLKFGAIGTGLGVLGGGIGLDDLAGAAMGRQKSAGALGLTAGQLSSFQANAQQFMGLGALTAAATAQTNPHDAAALATLGISQQEARSEPASRLAFQELKSARASWLRYKAAGLDEMASPKVQQAMKLGMSAGDIRNAAQARLSTINADEAATRRDQGQLGFSRSTAAEWTKLKIAIDKAGITIESSLIKSLSGLAPVIASMSKEGAHFIASLAGSKKMGEWVDEAKTDLRQFARFLGSPQFVADMHKLGVVISQGATEIAAIVKFLYPYAKLAAAKTPPVLDKVQHAANEAGRAVYNHVTHPAEQWFKRTVGWDHPKNNPLNIKEGYGWRQYKDTAAGIRGAHLLLETYPKNHHADTIASIIPVWNGHGKNDAAYIANVSRWSGIAPDAPLDMHDPKTMARLISAMSREEGTDRVSRKQVADAIGPGHKTPMPHDVVAAALAAHKRFVAADVHVDKAGNRYVPNAPGLPDSVTKLMRQMVKAQRAAKPVHLTVTNSTSARIAVSANAVAR